MNYGCIYALIETREFSAGEERRKKRVALFNLADKSKLCQEVVTSKPKQSNSWLMNHLKS